MLISLVAGCVWRISCSKDNRRAQLREMRKAVISARQRLRSPSLRSMRSLGSMRFGKRRSMGVDGLELHAAAVRQQQEQHLPLPAPGAPLVAHSIAGALRRSSSATTGGEQPVGRSGATDARVFGV